MLNAIEEIVEIIEMEMETAAHGHAMMAPSHAAQGRSKIEAFNLFSHN